MTTNMRKLVKALSWRLIALIVLTSVGFLITGSVKSAGFVAIIYSVIQVAVFFFHEKFWDRIKWGKLNGVAIQMTGLSGAGKSTIAQALYKSLTLQGFDVEVIDGDEYRTNLCSDLGFSREDRIENIRRLSFVAHKIASKGKISIIAAINPFEESRKFLKLHTDNNMTVFVDVPLEVAIDRDVKGLYRKALLPSDDPEHIPNFTGISDPFDTPKDHDVHVRTDLMSVEACAHKIEQEAKRRMK